MSDLWPFMEKKSLTFSTFDHIIKYKIIQTEKKPTSSRLWGKNHYINFTNITNWLLSHCHFNCVIWPTFLRLSIWNNWFQNISNFVCSYWLALHSKFKFLEYRLFLLTITVSLCLDFTYLMSVSYFCIWHVNGLNK